LTDEKFHLGTCRHMQY